MKANFFDIFARSLSWFLFHLLLSYLMLFFSEKLFFFIWVDIFVLFYVVLLVLIFPSSQERDSFQHVLLWLSWLETACSQYLQYQMMADLFLSVCCSTECLSFWRSCRTYQPFSLNFFSDLFVFLIKIVMVNKIRNFSKFTFKFDLSGIGAW